jgi:hypothetical protein
VSEWLLPSGGVACRPEQSCAAHPPDEVQPLPTSNENPPRISPGGPTSSAPSQLPVHPRSAALSRATVRYIGCNRDESMTSCRRMRLGGLADRARFGRLIDAPGHGSRKLCAGIHCAAVNSCCPLSVERLLWRGPFASCQKIGRGKSTSNNLLSGSIVGWPFPLGARRG